MKIMSISLLTGAAVLALAEGSAAQATTYWCEPAGGQAFEVVIDAETYTIDGSGAVKAEDTDQECHLEPPEMEVFVLNADLLFTLGEAGTPTSAGTCAPLG